MELKIKQFNKLITQCCKIIQDSHNNLEILLKDYDYNNSDRTQIDRNLIKMCVVSQKLMDLIMSIPLGGEIHGLPDEVTKLDLQDGLLIADKNNPKGDFTNWYKEKTSAIKDALNKLMEWLEINPNEYKIHPKAEMTAKEFINSMINSSMRGIFPYAQTILDMIESGRLIVSNIRLETEED